MTSGGLSKTVRYGLLWALLGVVASACTTSTTVPTATATPAPNTERATVDAVEPTAIPLTSAPETSEPTVAPDPTNAPVTPPGSAEFRDDSILGISNDGRFAYAGTTSPWNTQTSCDAAPTESLALLDLSVADEPVGVGLEQAGDVRQMIFGEGSRVAFISSCGSLDSPTLWLQRADLDSAGRIAALGTRLPIEVPDNEGEPWFQQWIDFDLVEAQVVIEVDPDDFDTWLLEYRQISTVTGEIVSAQQFPLYDDNSELASTAEYVSPGGRFTYRQVADPDGALGCEGYGVAAAIEVDDGTSRRLALGADGLVFSSIDEMHFDGNGYVAWTSGCEGYTSVYVGKVLDDGTIADAHFIETSALGTNDSFDEYQYFRLTGDGHLAGVGVTYAVNGDDRSIAVLRYDLSTDPAFVNTAVPLPVIDPNPLAAALVGPGTWHVGETLSSTPACGAKTLYAQTANGFVRAFPGWFELDEIVDLDVSETLTIEFDDGTSYSARILVLQTECPSLYEGRQVWFTTEPESVRWGFTVDRADLGEVADVLSVREQVNPESGFGEAAFAEVVLLDGTVTEVELVAVPFEG